MTTMRNPAQQSAGTTRHGPTAEEFAERFFTASLGAMEILSAYLGDRLGWYRSLAEAGRRPDRNWPPATPPSPARISIENASRVRSPSFTNHQITSYQAIRPSPPAVGPWSSVAV